VQPPFSTQGQSAPHIADASSSIDLAPPIRVEHGPPSRVARLLRLIYEYLVFYGSLMVFGAMGLVWSLPATVLYYLLSRRTGASLGQFVTMALFRSFIGVMEMSGIIKCDLTALDVLRGEPSIIIAPNHPSLLDAVLVISRLPEVVCIMKAKIWDNPLLGGGARLAGYIRNDTPVRMIKLAAKELEAGHQLLVFPEGTRTVNKPINPFKGGFAVIAKKATAPVQTVFIESNSPFLGKTWSLFKKPEFPLTYRARVGRRFEVGDDVQGFLAELERYYRAELGTQEPPPESP
jgi:1-acyl-sn-glycerol-3-phosphate acyltransferase